MTDIPTVLKEMFDGMDGSPKTTLIEPFIPESSTSIKIHNATYLPDAPNLCTISTSINNSNWYLIVKYETKTDNTLSGLTIIYGNPSDTITCPAGSFCFRGYNEYDQNTFIYNIRMIYQLLKDISITIQPKILSFNIIDLPSVLPIGTSFVGNHIFNHCESFILYIWENLKLYEDDIEINSNTIPSETSTSSTFTSSKIFTEIGSHTYRLSGVDSFNRIFEMTQTVNIIIPMYYGSIIDNTITQTNFDLLTASSSCYTGMHVSITSENNDYIWVCTINTKTITSITCDGFNVPIQTPINLTKTINGIDIVFNCYRITSPIVSGINNFVINFS